MVGQKQLTSTGETIITERESQDGKKINTLNASQISQSFNHSTIVCQSVSDFIMHQFQRVFHQIKMNDLFIKIHENCFISIQKCVEHPIYVYEINCRD